MKILAIRIKNLASLDGLTTIDFSHEPLHSAGIFAITGPTGAGKSTILDALCLALYGKTPRYLQARETGMEIRDVQGSTISQGDVRGILRDGTAEGYAEVDFVGTDKQAYQACWSVRRARNKADGSIQADSVTLKNLRNHTDLPGKKAEIYKEIERLVGLNFEQFTRSVLLAQGDFTAFLKAGRDEKASLLEKLTGTGIYSEISRKIYERYKEEELQLRDLTARKDDVKILTDEEISALKVVQEDLAVRLSISDERLKQLEKEVNWHEQLTDLQKGYALAEADAHQAVRIQESAADRRKKLIQTERVQQTRSWVDAWQSAEQRKAEKITSISALALETTSLREKKEALKIRLETAENELVRKKEDEQQTIPLLNKAKELDTLLKALHQQFDEAAKAMQESSTKYEQQQQILSTRQNELDTLAKDIKVLEDWKTAHADRKPIAENKDIILSKLQDAYKYVLDLSDLSDTIPPLTDKIENILIKKKETEGRLWHAQQEEEKLKKQHAQPLKDTDKTLAEILRGDKDETDKAIWHIIEAQKCWQMLHSLLRETDALRKKQTDDQTALEAYTTQLKQLQQELSHAQTAKEATEKVLTAARLAMAKDVETLRAQLSDHEPCPVCGSTHHPYQHQAPTNTLFDSIAENHARHEQEYLALFRQYNALEQSCRDVHAAAPQLAADIQAKNAELEQKQSEWAKLAISKATDNMAPEQKEKYLQDRLEDLQGRQTALKTEIERLDALKDNIDRYHHAIKDLQNHLNINLEQKKAKETTQKETLNNIKAVKETLDPYFTTPGWMEKWKAAPEKFLNHINTFSHAWKEKTTQIDKNQQLHGEGVVALKEMKIRCRELQNEWIKKKTAYARQEEDLKALNHQRNTIFDGKPADEMEKQLKKAIDEVQQLSDTTRQELQLTDIELTKYNTQTKQWHTAIAADENDIRVQVQKIENWLAQYNAVHEDHLSVEKLTSLLELASDWIETERAAIRHIDDEVTRTASVLNERSNALKVHLDKKLSDRAFDVLQQAHTTLQTETGQLKKQQHEAGFRLQQDQENRQKAGDLLKTIRKQSAITENWAKLNDVIGAADGKKFRQIAQEYTLDVLLSYANIHLETLASRYQIQRIPDSLGLQVVDQHMGDEIRTVYSLSGGESFLVSLALALGLSSLSSNRMKVESLFIDEGFGSLDPVTLHIAMDALERLHHQGRKVGVISHVQEMTERIPVQIKVSKMTNGKSKVEVLG